ncbi:Ig-like domain repeat protein [Limnoglobus roseus]|uniref:Bacterial Ig-like domain-containing protein n=1 Tax=Limnoglobus roseus TaxID=2598579 RepID=A0A5C1AK14_9BACT|nr:Ig-like domain repeat protein [Limnoglobus roseus]QEL19210.1 hypothetical protein PX52LOC_06270 [Limnoglobus roseus]
MNFRRSTQVGRKGRNAKYSPDKGSHSFKLKAEALEDRTQPATSATIMTAQYTPVARGVSDLLTATISVPAGSGSPTGMVTFSDVSNGATTVLGTANVTQVSSSPAKFAATLPATFTAEGSHYLTAAYSGDGTFDPSTGTFTVNSGTTAADFENFSLPPNSFYNGADGAGGFNTGGGQFNNSYNSSFDVWSGWSHSNVTDVTTAGFGNQYAAYNVPGGGTGAGGSANYGVAFGFPGSGGFPGDPITIDLPAGQRPQSMQITNTTYAALSMRDGDAFAKKFGGTTGNDPDFFLLTITGKNASGADTGTRTFYLADYRFADNSKDYIVSQWTTVDLSSLPTATTQLSFALSSSDVGTFGVNTPTYFAMDDLILTPDVSVTASPTGPVSAGTPVTFTATVAGNPSVGTVTFYAGPGLTDPIGSPVAVVGGTATSTATTTLPSGTNRITAVYSGGAGFDPSQSSVDFAVNTATTTTVTHTPAGPVTAGTAVTFTATVAGNPSVGTVTFYAGPGLTNPIGSPVTVAGGTATSAATATLPVGTSTITAVYSGGTGFDPSQGTVAVTVNAATTTSVAAAPTGPVSLGTPVAFTATVAGSGNAGTVTFYAGPGLTNPIGAPIAVTGGTATSAVTTALPAGSNTITAVYSGGTGIAGSQGTVGVTVNATTVTTVAAAPAGPVTAGTPVAFTATVTGSPSVGTVTFYAGPGLTNPIGTPVTVAGGTATSAATATLPVGTSTITAVYSGGAGFDPSQGTVGVTVNAATTTSVAAAPTGPVSPGTPVAFTATVTGSPSVGTVTFYAGPGLTNPIGTPVTVVTGTATSAATATLPVGTSTITAVYSGGPGLAGSQGTVDVTINAVTATTVAAAPAGPVSPGTPVAFTATVTGSPSVGTVTFYAGPGLTNPIGTPVTVTGGTATSVAATLPLGSTTITAVYSGGTGFAGSQGTVGVMVDAAIATATSVAAATSGPVTAGTPVAFTATVTGNPSVGTVTFYAGPGLTNPIGSPVTVVSGTATSATTAVLPVGSNRITAVYSGGTGFTASQGTIGVTVNAAIATATNVVVAPSGPVTAGTAVTFTATVAGNPSVGTVTFYAGPGLTNPIGSPVTVVGGTATSAATATLPVGTATITAVYSGGTGFDPSQGTVTVTVNAATANPDFIGVPQFAVGSDVGGPSTVIEYNSDGSVAKTFDPFPRTTGGTRTAVGDFNGDGTPDVAVGTGPGVTAQVKVLDGKTGAVLFDVTPFADFTGGVFVALGDVTGDGKADLVVSPDMGGGPRVSLFRGGDFVKAADFFGIDDPAFRGGARASLGDLNGDGVADLVVSAGFGGGPRISVYDGKSLAGGQQVHLVPDFFLFEDTLRNGAYVAVGDVNGDGFADIIGGGGPGGGPRVLALSGKTLLTQGVTAAFESPVANFFAGDTENRGGIRVSVKDLDGDERADVVVGSGTGAGSAVTAYTGSALTKDPSDPTAEMQFDAFPNFTGGVYVG